MNVKLSSLKRRLKIIWCARFCLTSSVLSELRLGTTIGGSFDYQVPNLPLFIKAYGRGNATTAAGGDDIADKPTGWINLGAIISYDISTLF